MQQAKLADIKVEHHGCPDPDRRDFCWQNGDKHAVRVVREPIAEARGFQRVSGRDSSNRHNPWMLYGVLEVGSLTAHSAGATPFLLYSFCTVAALNLEPR
jgi:hypothetical protein